MTTNDKPRCIAAFEARYAGLVQATRDAHRYYTEAVPAEDLGRVIDVVADEIGPALAALDWTDEPVITG